MDLPVTIPLDYPVEHAGLRYTELTIARRPTVEDAVAAAEAAGTANPQLQEPHMLARLAGVPYGLIAKIDMLNDYRKLAAVVAGFQTAPAPARKNGAAASSSPPGSATPPSAS